MAHSKWGLWWACAVGVLALAGCSPMEDPWKDTNPPRVVVTFPPLYSFTRGVAGKHGAVKVLCKEEGPHHYGLNYADTALLRRADLFFANGLELEVNFADQLQQQSNNPNLRYVKLGDRLPHDKLIAWEGEHHHEHGHDHGHSHGEYDPHVWLGNEEAVLMVGEIRDELKRADPEHEKDYDKNAEEYIGKLKELKEEWKGKFAKKNARIVSVHESLRYFARSYGLEVVGVISLVPGDKPTPAQLRDLVEMCQKHKVRVIAIEPQYPETAAETLKKELQAKGQEVELVKIDPLETAEWKDLEKEGSKWYLNKTEANLEALEKALR
jgi:zinc transport system substrate-binding protein